MRQNGTFTQNNEPPAQVGQDGAADERAEDRAEQRGQRDEGDRTAQRIAPAACMMSVVSTDSSSPPPAPWTTRQAIRESAFQARLDRWSLTRNTVSAKHPQSLAAVPPQSPGGERHRHASASK